MILGILLFFGGYVFVYSATAAGGKFAPDPWASLYADAYTTDLSGGSVASYPPSTAPTRGPGAASIAAIAQRRRIPVKAFG